MKCPQCKGNGYYLLDCYRIRIDKEDNPYEFHWEETKRCWNCGGKGIKL